MSNVIHGQAELFNKIAAGQAALQQAKDALSYTQCKHSSVLQSTTAVSFDGRRKLSSSFSAKDRADKKIDQHCNDVGECSRHCVRAKKCTERIMRDVLLLLDSMLQGQQVSHHEISHVRDKVVSEVLAMTESQEQ
ncbi:hypothetical protein CEUSTIGMA_g5698.t1 [Chlamydomonas eustigma]|uniref:Uncharacterized protein n=1 Tax=Chlamydomonas eustigma TaxID=1157962 RepID=A0A250X5D5_9CHLO|nr:hypothetical protein CEUSTIGMA_g5698.t1 [Chlamydomonas eustigma]|eukprot:GAX78256.1 hypothetical protein CEUSTIGMA_g5698.t1 [Chlamydomonas eustigma]